MCTGIETVAAIGALATVAGTITTAMGQARQGDATAAAARYRQKQQQIQAADALKRGAQKEEAQRRKTAALKSKQLAVMAASNLDIGSGSPLDILSDTAQLGELDAQVIRGNAEREAAGLEAGADLSGLEADSAQRAGNIAAFGTVLGGVGSVASKWYDVRTA